MDLQKQANASWSADEGKADSGRSGSPMACSIGGAVVMQIWFQNQDPIDLGLCQVLLQDILVLWCSNEGLLVWKSSLQHVGGEPGSYMCLICDFGIH